MNIKMLILTILVLGSCQDTRPGTEANDYNTLNTQEVIEPLQPYQAAGQHQGVRLPKLSRPAGFAILAASYYLMCKVAFGEEPKSTVEACLKAGALMALCFSGSYGLAFALK
jgi:hypothetical protein